MKKKRLKDNAFLSNFKRLLLIMKLTIVLIFAGLIAASASVYSQATKLSLDLKDVSILEVFKQIEAGSEFVFIYKNEIIDLSKKVNVKVEGSTVDMILDEVFKNLNLKYEIIDKQIVITPARSIPATKPGKVILQEQQKPATKQIRGKVTDAKGEPIPGSTVIVKGTTVGVVTDNDGNFVFQVPLDAKVLSVSFVGYNPTEINIGNQTSFSVALEEMSVGVDDVVVVGYATQKKASVVGAISQVTSEDIVRAGSGSPNLGQSLIGTLPGVAALQTSGDPGNNDPKIYIRGRGTWDNASPLILVDGVERALSDIDVNEVESISVLKDASATAVFGVKGSEGVILITSKRGKLGKPIFSIDASMSTQMVSRVPNKLDSYDQFDFRNKIVEYQLNLVNDVDWASYMPYEMMKNYRSPQPPGYKYLFPNVDWPKETVNPFPLSRRINLNVSGGSDFAKFFGSLSYNYDDDMLKTGTDPMNAGYKTSSAYQRVNFRTNLDMNFSPTTVFSANIYGFLGRKNAGYGSSEANENISAAFYQLPPDAFPIFHEDGSYGYSKDISAINPIRAANSNGLGHTTTTNINTDFALTQKLDFITNGLSAKASVSFDNTFFSRSGIQDGGQARNLYIDPEIINIKPGEDPRQYKEGYLIYQNANQDFDWVPGGLSYEAEGSINAGSTSRRLFYQGQINYDRSFGVHDITALALANRENYASGNMFPRYREDWVGRLTYGYDSRYLFETNFAYNGSEKFGSGYRFGFFPSIAAGWVLSNEPFLKRDWLDKLKVRYSIGKVGNDSGGDRWQYLTYYNLDSGGWTYFGYPQSLQSPEIQYIIGQEGNPDLQWAVSTKQDLGLELAIFKNKFGMNVDLFKEARTGLVLKTDPRYIGSISVPANLGETEVKGYEIEMFHRNTLKNEFSYSVLLSYTGAFDKVIYRQDPPLLDAHQKAEGFPIGLMTRQINVGFVENWDDVFSSPAGQSNRDRTMPGDFRILDFNADGKLDGQDATHYGYSFDRPQHTYNAKFSFDYKGFSLSAQFYGNYNIGRKTDANFYPFRAVTAKNGPVFEEHLDMWEPDNPSGKNKIWRIDAVAEPGFAEYYVLGGDGSFLRLRTAEIAYTFKSDVLKSINASSLRVYLNGNNLLFWSKMLDDREYTDIAGLGETRGNTYPNTRRINLGVAIKF